MSPLPPAVEATTRSALNTAPPGVSDRLAAIIDIQQRVSAAGFDARQIMRVVFECVPALVGAFAVGVERQGYRVLEAGNGVEGLARAATHEGNLDLVLTDVVMPELDGRAMLEQLLLVRPNVPVVFMSGYPGDEVVRRGVMDSGHAFLAKPFAVSELIQQVDAAIRTRRR